MLIGIIKLSHIQGFRIHLRDASFRYFSAMKNNFFIKTTTNKIKLGNIIRNALTAFVFNISKI